MRYSRRTNRHGRKFLIVRESGFNRHGRRTQDALERTARGRVKQRMVERQAYEEKLSRQLAHEKRQKRAHDRAIAKKKLLKKNA